MKSVGVLGNCNIHGVGRAVRALTGSDVKLYGVETFDGQAAGEAAAALSSHDFIVAIEFEDRFAGGTDALKAEMGDRLLTMPAFVFGAFQPDMAILRQKDEHGGKIILSPIGVDSSSLVSFGYLNGLSIDETCRLFCEKGYRSVGYLDAWFPAAENFKRRFGARYGSYLVQWSRRGCFTYTFNHPKSFVLFDITRETLGDKIVNHVPDLSEILPDDLRGSAIWPVYPDIAKRYGVEGNYWFKPHLEDRIMNLETFVSESYALYQPYDPRELECWQVSGWDTEKTTTLMSIARG